MRLPNNRYSEIFSSIKYWPRTLKLLFEVNKRYMFFILMLSIVAGILPPATLIITQELINTIIASIGKSFTPIIYWFILLVSVSIIMSVIESIQSYLQNILQLLIVYKLNIKLMEKASNLSLSDFENSEIYDKLQRAQNEVGHRPFEIFTTMLSIITGVITVISSSFILIKWKWWVFLILILSPLFSTYYSLKIGKREFDIQNRRAPIFRKSWYYSFLLTKDINFKEIKAFDLGSYIVNEYRKIYNRFLKVDKKISKKKSLISFGISILEELIGDLVSFLIIFSTFIGEISVGNLVSYTRAVTMCITNFKLVFGNIASLFQNNLFIKQFFQFIDLEESNDIINKKTYEKINSIEKIEFRNVSFKYPNSKKYALKNISFTIKKGEIIGIVGKNGSGKSTIIKLLLRLYKVEEGKILINDKDIMNYSEKKLRKKMSVVFQDYIKYELKLKHNIGFGDIENLRDTVGILKSVNKSGIDEFLHLLPEGINTQLGSWFADSHQLSGGQWQRIAIARAFFRKGDLYILDEPSSVLDPIAEKEVFRKFFSVVKHKIGIFTTHRFSTVKFADKILVFNEGCLIEVGNHFELIEKNGFYKKLYDVQASPFNENYIQYSIK